MPFVYVVVSVIVGAARVGDGGCGTWAVRSAAGRLVVHLFGMCLEIAQSGLWLLVTTHGTSRRGLVFFVFQTSSSQETRTVLHERPPEAV